MWSRWIAGNSNAPTLDETRHLYYTEPAKWQVIEERLDSDTTPNRQFIWGIRYIDDLILRDRDTTDNGTLNERLYAIQDANWNMTAITDTIGAVKQRMSYAPYGNPGFLASTFADGTNSFGWETLYAGYRWDETVLQFHVRHRVLNPVIGTWIQRDPVGLAAGPSLYQYANMSPLTYIDPNGTFICDIVTHDAYGCFCSVIDFISLLGGLVPRGVPWLSAIAASMAALDCFCDLGGLLATTCIDNPRGCFSDASKKAAIAVFLGCVVSAGLSTLPSPAEIFSMLANIASIKLEIQAMAGAGLPPSVTACFA